MDLHWSFVAALTLFVASTTLAHVVTKGTIVVMVSDPQRSRLPGTGQRPDQPAGFHTRG